MQLGLGHLGNLGKQSTKGLKSNMLSKNREIGKTLMIEPRVLAPKKCREKWHILEAEWKQSGSRK